MIFNFWNYKKKPPNYKSKWTFEQNFLKNLMFNSGRTLAINYAENFAACCDWRCFTVSNCCCKSSLKYLLNFLILINALKSSYPMKKGTPHFNTGVSSKGHSFSAPKAVSSTRQFSTNASVQWKKRQFNTYASDPHQESPRRAIKPKNDFVWNWHSCLELTHFRAFK